MKRHVSKSHFGLRSQRKLSKNEKQPGVVPPASADTDDQMGGVMIPAYVIGGMEPAL